MRYRFIIFDTNSLCTIYFVIKYFKEGKVLIILMSPVILLLKYRYFIFHQYPCVERPPSLYHAAVDSI